jgi:hypothetical protein
MFASLQTGQYCQSIAARLSPLISRRIDDLAPEYPRTSGLWKTCAVCQPLASNLLFGRVSSEQ